MTEILKFLEAHGDALFGLLYRITLREDVAEDLMQELFLRLRAADACRTARSPLAYARRTALHLAFDWRRNRTEVLGVELGDRESSDDGPSPLERLIEVEQIQTVLEAMAGLSPRDRELLMMHYIEQQSYEALAQDFDKTPHQIRALCYKALVQLRELLAEASQRTDRGGHP
ncbi:MAG: RNA polymerase sigma factor [Planctomycetota bacterium]